MEETVLIFVGYMCTDSDFKTLNVTRNILTCVPPKTKIKEVAFLSICLEGVVCSRVYKTFLERENVCSRIKRTGVVSTSPPTDQGPRTLGVRGRLWVTGETRSRPEIEWRGGDI